MHNERYPETIINFSAWYGARMKEIEQASSPEQIASVLGIIGQYVDAKWCFPNRLSDAELIAGKVRRKNGWERPRGFTGRLVGEGDHA